MEEEFDIGDILADTYIPISHLEEERIAKAYRISSYICLGIMPPIIICNIMIFCGMTLYPGFYTSINVLLMNLAIADFLMGIFGLPFYVLSSLPLTKDYVFSHKYTCLTRFASMVLCAGGSLYSLMFISLDRYFAIMWPLHYYSKIGVSCTVHCMQVFWLYIVVLAFIPLLGYNQYDDKVMPLSERCSFTNVLPLAYILWIVVVVALGCIVTSLILNIRIACTIRNKRKRRSSISLPRRNSTLNVFLRVSNIHITIVLMFLFIILWLPFLAVSLIKSLKIINPVDMEIAYCSAMLISFINSLVNAPVYAFFRMEYREVYKIMLTSLPWHWRKELRDLHRRTHAMFHCTLEDYMSCVECPEHTIDNQEEIIRHGSSVDRHECLHTISFEDIEQKQLSDETSQ
ncbi:adenosine receptor A2b-like [Physella acuta]|uniref:adenosine receptor A2b-like n=1 Tax=Physella acuta TaxID=109671 RepID=UPI0027DDF08F|nr:adenosine receptor A2b-like [Physella acuta]